MTIYDIADRAGVSIATVSRVVNGSDKVRPKTKEKVLKVIEEAGYTPNVFAQGLGLNTMHTVGILVPDISDLYMSSAVSCLEDALHLCGYDCILSGSGFDIRNKRAHVQLLLSKKIDALIMVGSTYAGAGTDPTETDYIREAAKQVPVFLINGVVEGDNIYCAVCDDCKAVHQMVDAMIKSDKKRILFLTDSHSYSAQQKMLGYKQALSENGIAFDESLSLYVRNGIHEVYYQLLAQDDLHFDACFATDDSLAIGVLKYAKAKKLRVPEDISVVGCNNSYLSIACEPELTSIDNRLEDICRSTVEHLMNKLHGGNDIPSKTIVPSTIQLRAST
ncbi:MAG: LacI family transcriptional regulator [Lachnospiraceae bacterium]|nr:LacI family transcriptional regulator [Lachnospiraceae bacterium]